MSKTRVIELRQKRAKQIADARSLLESAGERALTQEEQNNWDAMMSQAEALKATIDREERQLATEADLGAPVTGVTPPDPEGRGNGDRIELPRPPLQSVTSITYVDSDGVTRTMPGGDYWVDSASEPGRVILGFGKSWPSATLRPGPAITITYVAGYGLRAAVPQIYKQAIELLAGHYYENREQVIAMPGVTIAELPLGVQSLLMIDRGAF